MKTLSLISIFLPSIVMGSTMHSVGGQYASQASSAVARDNTETSIYLNPAGLAKIQSNSISSGTSSLNLVNSSTDSYYYSSLNSSSNHIAYVEKLKNYNIGFMIFNSSATEIVNEDLNKTTTSEGFNFVNDSKSSTKGNAQSYIIAIAKKDSQWGMNISFIDNRFNMVSNYFQTNYSNIAPESRFNNMFNYDIRVETLSTTLSFGYQNKLNQNYIFGILFTTPEYTLLNNSKANMSAVLVNGDGTNDANIINMRQDSDIELENKINGPMVLSLGLARNYKNISVEYGIDIVSASRNKEFDPKEDAEQSIWLTRFNQYTTDASENTSFEAAYERAVVNVRAGISYSYSPDLTLGGGIALLPTSGKNNQGSDTAVLTTGISKRHKNFIGNYTFGYIKGVDAGNNETPQNLEQFSFIASGAYYF